MNNFNVNEFVFENEYLFFDATKFPFIYIKFKIKESNRKQFEDYLCCINTVILMKKDYVLLSELQDTEYMKAELRKQLDQWVVENSVHINTFCKGAANVVLDEEQRILLNHMSKTHSPAYPLFITDSKEKVEKWLEGRV